MKKRGTTKDGRMIEQKVMDVSRVSHARMEGHNETVSAHGSIQD